MGMQANVKNRPRYAQTASSTGSGFSAADVLVLNEFSNSRSGIFFQRLRCGPSCEPDRPALDRCSSRSVP